MTVLYRCMGKLSGERGASGERSASSLMDLRSRRRTARPARAATSDWSGFSPQPPVPVQEPVAEEEGNQSHAAEKDAKGHLVMAVNHLRRLPATAAGGGRTGQAPHEAVRALQPDDEDGGQAKQ